MEKLLTVKEVSEQLRLSIQTVYKLLKEGSIRGIRVGSQWRISEESMMHWLKKEDFQFVPASLNHNKNKNRKTVLCVDDDPLIQSLVSDLLESSELNVINMESGEKALDLIRNQPSLMSVILMDLMMPEINGMDVYREIRKAGVHAPVIFITGNAISPALDDVRGFSNVSILEKPFGRKALLETISAHVVLGRD